MHRFDDGRARRPVATARALSALALDVSLVLSLLLLPTHPARAAESCNWVGDELPLPLTVKTAQDIAFKAAVERQYLVFNLMAGGRLAWQRGDYATAVEKWEALLKIPNLDSQIERAIEPALSDARRRVAHPAVTASPVASAAAAGITTPPPASERGLPAPSGPPSAPRPARPADGRTTLNGVVLGGGQNGPGGAVVWLKRLDGRMPAVAPATGRFITQRDKSFLPHVLAIPVGTTVEFRNEDRIYHNVFSLNKPNDFDAGIRASGTTYSRTFENPGPVELLCNIHSTMNAYVIVIDSPYFTKTRPTGAFALHGVWPGQYELSVWHEGSTAIAHKKITVSADGSTRVSVAVDGDKRPAPFVLDKYGHKRQPHLGY